ncbi:MAG TPA: HD domain-containing protein [Pyrinomonadaceae bacterium]|nr:HD domain-containing protein [Pyrinomonadaceae bacterium]
MQGSQAKAVFEEKLLDLSTRIDQFEGYMHAHGLRIAEIADGIASTLGIPFEDRFTLQQAALVHDIGEMAMNRGYIRENRVLTDVERLDMQRHPVIGEQETAKRGFNRGVQLLVRWHHEWWNGEGYPDRLRAEEIPIGARILRVADAYAALTDDRPRRQARTADEAKQYLREYAAIEFDPAIVKLFLSEPGAIATG